MNLYNRSRYLASPRGVFFVSWVCLGTMATLLQAAGAQKSNSDPGLTEKVKTRGLMFETIAHGGSSGIKEERLEVIRDQAAWNEFWISHAGARSPAPIVDFQKKMVIVVLLTRPTGGYAVNVTRIEKQPRKFIVYYDELIPGPRCGVTTILTQPYHIIKLRRTDNEPRFIKKEKIQEC